MRVTLRIAVLLLLCLPLAAPVSAQAQQRETIFWLERVEEGTNNPTGEVLGRYGFLEEGDEFRVVVRYSLPFIVNDDIVLTFGTHLSDVSREDFARRDGTCLPVLLKSKKNPYTLNTGDIPFGLAYNINNPATHEGAIRLCRDGRAEDTETLIVQYVRNHGSGGIGLQIPTREELNLESVGYGIMANGRGPRVGINRVPASSSQDLRGIHIPEGDRVPGFAFNADYIHEEGTNRQFEVRLCNYVGSGGERIRATDDCRFAQRYTGARIGQSDLSFGFDSVRSTAETDDIRLRTSTDGSLSPDLDEWNPSTGIGIMHIPTARDTSVIDFQLVDDTAPETTETVIFILNLHSIGEVGARRLEPRPGRQYGFDYRPFLAAVIPPNDTFEANLTGLPSHQPDEGTTFTFTVNLADGDLPVRQDALALQIRDSVNSRPADATSDEWEFVSARRIFGDGRPPAAATGYTERGTADLAQICPTSAGGYRDRVVAGRVTGNPVDLQELIYDCDLGFHVTTGTRQIEVTLRVRDDDVREVDPRLYIRVAAVPANHPSHGHRYENQWREIRLAPSELFLNPPSLSFRPTVTRNERTTYIVNSNINPDSGASGQGLVTTWRWLLRDLAGNDVSARYGFTFDTMTIMGTEATSSEVRFNLPDVVVRETLRFCVEANSGADRFRDSRFNESCSLVHVNDTETPSADAGANPGPLPDDEPFTLHGSGSDPDDDPGLTYRWEQTSPAPDGDGLNPEVAFGSHANSTGTVTVTLPDLPAGTTAGFTLKLTVADSAVAGRASLTSTDTVAIVVHDSTPPTAAAGADQAVGTGGVMIALDGGVSHDARGPGFTGTDRLRYRWQQVESDDPAAAAVGTVGPIANATAATATFTAPTTAGHYYFRLTVMDTVTRRSDADVVRVTVQEEMTVSVAGDVSADEGGLASLVVRVSGGPPVSDITVGYRVTTATETVVGHAGVADYAVGGAGVTTDTVTVGAPSYRATTVTFTANADDDLEGAESFRLVLGAVSGGTIGDSGVGISRAEASSSVVVVINDTDRVTRRVARTDEDGFVEGGAGGAATALLDFIVEGAELPQALDHLALGYRVGGCVDGASVHCTVLPSGTSGAVAIVPSPGRLVSTGTVTVMTGGHDNDVNEATRTITVTMDDVLGITASDFGGIASSGAVSWEVDLADDDDIAVGISPPETSARGSRAVFVVTLSGAVSGSRSVIEIPYSIGGEVETADYMDMTAPLNNGRLVFNAFETTGTITLQLTGDAATTDPDETLTVALGAPVVGAGGGRAALSDLSEVTVSVFRAPRVYRVRADETEDADAAAPGVQVAEGTTATFTVTLEGEAPTAPTTVTWSVGSDDLAASEYEVAGVGGATSGVLMFTPANWQTPQTVEVKVNDDGLNEGSERLSLTLSDVTGGGVSGTAIAVPSAEVIVPPSDAITYRVEGAAVTEPSADFVTATFTIHLDGAPQGSAGEITVPFTIGGSASPGSDYAAPPTTVSVAGGAITAEVEVRVLADANNEGAETITLALRDGAQVGAGGGVAMAVPGAGRLGTITIADNADDTVRMSIIAVNARVIEGGTALFTASLSQAAPTAPVEVPFSVVGDAADYDIVSPPGLDAAATTGVLTIETGAPAGRIELLATDDIVPEDDETLRVVLGEPRTAGGVFADPNSATVIINAGDRPTPAPALVIAADNLGDDNRERGGEGNPVSYPLTATITRAAGENPLEENLSLLAWQWRQVVSTAADAAAVPADDLSVHLGAISDAAGEFSAAGAAAVAAMIAPRVYVTGNYHFRLTVTATRADHLPVVVSDVVSIRFRDSDAPATPEVSVAGADAVAADGNGHLLLTVREGDRVVITTTATDLNPAAVTVDLLDDRHYEWSTDNTPGFFSAALEPDVTPARVTGFTTPAHPTTGSSTTYRHRVVAVDDGGERSAPRNVTIVHRDNAVPVAAAGPDREVGIDGPVMLDGGASLDARGPGNTGQLQYRWQQVSTDSAAATAVAGGVALNAADTAVARFDAPSQMETLYFRLTVTDTRTLRSSFDTVAITVLPRQTLGIVSAPRAVTEGEVIRFTVAIGAGQPQSDGSVSVDWSISGSGGNPAEPGDFDYDAEPGPDTVFPSGTAVIASGLTFTVVTVPTLDDLFLEGAETYRITLGNPQSTAFAELNTAAAQQSGEIRDNDLGNYSVVVDPPRVGEGGRVTFTLELAEALPEALSVPFEVGGDGIEAGDFDIVQAPRVNAGAMAGTVTVPPAVTRAQVVLAIADDGIQEANEVLRMSFGEAGSGLVGNVTISGDAAAYLHIVGGEDDWFTGQYRRFAALPPVTSPPPLGLCVGRTPAEFRPGYELVEGTTATFSIVLGNLVIAPGIVRYTEVYQSASTLTVAWRLDSNASFYGGSEISRQSHQANFEYVDSDNNSFTGSGLNSLEGRATLPAGSTKVDISFRVLQDGVTESESPFSGDLARLWVTGVEVAEGGSPVQAANGGFDSCDALIHIEARQLSVTGPARITETDSDQDANYLITLTGEPFPANTDIRWSLSPATGRSEYQAVADDFSGATSGVVTFGPGDAGGTTRAVAAVIRGDNMNEREEYFVVRVVVPQPDAAGGTRHFDGALGNFDNDLYIAPRFGSLEADIVDDDEITVTILGKGGFTNLVESPVLGLNLFSVAPIGVNWSGAVPSRVSVLYRIRSVPGVRAALPPGDYTIEGADPVTGFAESVIYTDRLGNRVLRNEVVFSQVTMFPSAPEIAAGRLVRSLIPLVNDEVNEPPEAFGVEVLIRVPGASTGGDVAGGGQIERSHFLGYIVNDEDPIVVSFAATSAAINEGDTVELPFSLNRPTPGRLTAQYTVTPSEESPPPYTDHTGGRVAVDADSSRLVLDAGSTNGVIVLGSNSDGGVHGNNMGSLRVSLDSFTGDEAVGIVTAVAPLAVNVVNVRFRALDREFSVTADQAGIEEGATATFTVRLDGMAPDLGTSSSVTWAVGGGVDAADYAAPASGRLFFTGTGSQKVHIPTLDDRLNEATERLTLSLIRTGGVDDGISTAAATVNIFANDELRMFIAFLPPSVGSPPDGIISETPGMDNFARLVVTVNNFDTLPAAPLTVPYRVTTASAGIGDTDYRFVRSDGTAVAGDSGAVIIPAGRPAEEFFLAAVDDAVPETTETLVIALGEPVTTVGGGINFDERVSGTVMITIRPSDQPLPAPVVMIAADDFGDDNFQNEIYALTATATRSPLETGPPSQLNYQWRQVASTAANADTVSAGDPAYLGEIAGAAGVVPANGIAAASISPDVRVTGDYHFRLAVTASRADAMASTTATDVVTVRFRDTDRPIPPFVRVTGDVTMIAREPAAVGGPERDSFRLEVRDGQRIELTVIASDRDEGTLLNDSSYRWSTATEGADFFALAEVTPARVTTFTVPQQTRLGGVTEYRYRVAATDSGGETGEARTVVIAHGDDSAPVAVAAFSPARPTSGDTVTLAGGGSRNAGGGGALTFRWRQVASTAADAAEVTPGDFRYLALAGENAATATFTVGLADIRRLVNNNLVPPVLYFRLTVTDGDTGTDDSAAVAVALGVPSRTVSAANPDDAQEGAATPAVIRLALAGAVAHTRQVTATWVVTTSAAAGDDDVEPQDFCGPDAVTALSEFPRGTVIFEPGADSAEVSLVFCDDNEAEGRESYDVTFSNLGAAGNAGTTQFAGGAGTLTVSGHVESSVNLPLVSLVEPVADAGEGSSQTWRIQIDRVRADAVAVAWEVVSATRPGTSAASPADFADAQGTPLTGFPITGSVTIAAGDTEARVTLHYATDAELDEPTEIYLMRLTAAAGLRFAPGAQEREGRIARDGASAGVTARAASSPEGGQAVFVIALGSAQDAATTVHWTLGGSAVRGVDYTGNGVAAGQPATMTYMAVIAAGSTREEVTLAVTDDNFNEATETVVLTLAREGGSVIRADDASASYDIVDNDPMVVRLSGGGEAPEGGMAMFMITLGSSPTTTVEVPWRVDAVGGSVSADDFSDYSALPLAGTATFTAGGVTTATVSIAIAADRTLEPLAQAFQFSVSAAAVTGAHGETTVEGSPVSASIAADAPPPVVVAALQTPLAEEGDTSPTFVITLRDNDGPLLSGRDIRMTYALTGTAVGGADYRDDAAGTVTIAEGGSETRVVLGLADDDLNESTESVTLVLSGSDPAGAVSQPLPAPVTIEITDNDVITATVAGPSSPVPEGGATTFTVSLAGGRLAAGTTLTIPWNIRTTAATGDDDAEASDFGGEFPSGTVSFGAGETQAVTEPIGISQDYMAEGAEAFSIVLGESPDAAGRVISRGVSTTATIAASTEIGFVFSITATTASVAEGGAALPATFIVRVEGPGHASTVSVDYTLSGTARLSGENPDYSRADGGDSATGRVLFAAGKSMESVNLNILPEQFSETTETIIATLSNADNGANTPPAGIAPSPQNAATIRIRANDELPIAVSTRHLRSRVGEGAGNAVVSIAADDPSPPVFETTAMVSYTLGGTATEGEDYNPPAGYLNGGGTVVLPAGWPLLIPPPDASVTIPLIDDDDNESTETIVVTVSDVVVERGHWRIQEPRRLSIVDDDPLRVSITGPGAPADEGGNAVFSAVLDGSNTPTAAVMVDYRVVPGGGVDADDITGALTGSVTIAVNSASGAISIPIRDDTTPESTETLTVRLTGARSAGAVMITQADAQADISRSDVAQAAVVAVNTTRTESGQAVFNLQFVSADGAPLSLPDIGGAASAVVGWSVGGTAAAGEDYPAADASGSATVPFNAAAPVSITLTDDSVNEAAETVILSLDSITVNGAAADYLEVREASRTATVRITDNDAAGVSIARTSAEELREGQRAAFELALSPASAGAMSVSWRAAVLTQTNTAASGDRAANTETNSDFSGAGATTGTIVGTTVIAAGTTRATISFGIRQDLSEEDIERVDVRITGVEAGAGAGAVAAADPSSASFRILANSAATRFLAVRAGGGVFEEDTAGEDTAATFTIELSGARPDDGSPVTVDWIVAGGGVNPAEAADYRALTGTLTFSALGSRTTRVSIVNDTLNESTETLVAMLVNESGGGDGGVAVSTATAEIELAQSDAITYRIGIADGDVEETGEAVFTVTLSGESEGDVTIPLTFLGTATGGADYTVPSPAAATVAAGETAANVVIALINDVTTEDAETITVALDAASPSVRSGVVTPTTDAAGRRATATIAANDPLRLSVRGPANLNEADGAAAIGTWTVSFDADSGVFAANTAASWSVAHAGTDDNDFTAVSGPLSFAAGSTAEVTFQVGVADDNLNEGAEQFSVGLAAPGAVLTVSTQMTTIAANDPLRLSVRGPANLDEADGAAATGDWTVSFDADSGVFTGDMAASWRVVHDGTDDNDFTAVGGPLSFAARSTADVTFRVGVADDNLNEGAEQFSVGLAAPGVSLAVSTQTTTIAANDRTTVSVSPPQPFAEGAPPRFALNFGGGDPTAPVTVLWSITSDTAASAMSASPQDFGESEYPVTGSAVIAPAGARAVTVPVAVDDPDSDDETFVFTLTGVSGGGGAGAGAVAPSTVVALISGIDLRAPQLSGLSFAAGQRRVWLRADEDLAVLRPSQAAATNVPAADGAALGGFTLRIAGGASSGTVTVSRARYSAPRGVVLELARALTAEEEGVGVFASYQYPGGDAPGLFDRALEAGRNTARNQLTSQIDITIPYGVTVDSDGDGLPDAAEARAADGAGNPLAAAAPRQLPAFRIEAGRRGAAGSPARIAYSGLRELGMRAHLGVSSVANTTQTAAANLRAYYLSDTFGYDGGYGRGTQQLAQYGCIGRFPANYAAPVSHGGCETVDWGNVAAGVEHRIGWLALGGGGLWAVSTGTASNLPEQVIERIPELNMASQRLFTTGTMVSVRALADDGASFATQTNAAGVLTAAQLAGGESLWHPATASAQPMPGDYSLGLSTRTVVVRMAAGTPGIPPVLGAPVVTSGGRVVTALVRGATYTLEIPASVGGFVMTATTSVPVPASAPAATTRITVAVRGVGAGVATTTLVVPVVAPGSAAAGVFGDADADGIADGEAGADAFDAFDAVAHLPVSVLRGDAAAAGMSGWHHIRPVLPRHALRIGDAALARVSSSSGVRYRDHAASRFDAAGLPVVYDFSLYGVDYAGVATATGAAAGGSAGVIIPLPEDLRGVGLSLVKYDDASGEIRPFVTGDGDRYGFAPLRDGACPDDTGGNYDFAAAAGDCLAVHIADGGANDADGLVNSVVKDPLGVRRGARAGGGAGAGRGHSGAFDPLALTVLLLLLFALPARRAARRRETDAAATGS